MRLSQKFQAAMAGALLTAAGGVLTLNAPTVSPQRTDTGFKTGGFMEDTVLAVTAAETDYEITYDAPADTPMRYSDVNNKSHSSPDCGDACSGPYSGKPDGSDGRDLHPYSGSEDDSGRTNRGAENFPRKSGVGLG